MSQAHLQIIGLKKILVIGLLAMLFTTAIVLAQDEDLLSFVKAQDQATSLQGFAYVYQIAQGRRCMNCHGNAHPWNGEAKNFKPHAMNISRLHMSGRLGISCTTCHAQSQSSSPGTPPGIVVEGDSRMPPEHMAFSPGMSGKKLCETFLAFDPSPARKKLLHHVEEDPFIIWAWNPGGGRKPAPGNHEQFVNAIQQWLENGAFVQQSEETCALY